MTQIRILIADDHEVVRNGVRDLLNAQPEFKVVCDATNGRDAIKLAEKHKPDVAVIDVSMPDLNGMDATRLIRKLSPETRVLIFSMHETEHLVHEVFNAGAQGYVLKSDAGTHLIAAVKALAAGGHFCSSQLSDVIFSAFLRSGGNLAAPAGDPLTLREREIIQLLAEGKSNKEVAQLLGISVKTAETHRAAIMRKLRLSTFSDLVRYAIRNKIIEA
jgi:DNA-binding NarL/FixJ family response regulator